MYLRYLKIIYRNKFIYKNYIFYSLLFVKVLNLLYQLDYSQKNHLNSLSRVIDFYSFTGLKELMKHIEINLLKYLKESPSPSINNGK